ncbi:4Fe-4S dicluster domain-containing protein [Comamonas sp. JC664]|uniref:4Fe-4S dicluster domain-containing protein n=1 Tax=Comamonas sp. JC664 TaxID=2801917 RepID=UPI003618BD35
MHCKTCDIKDPTQNIVWVTPEGAAAPTTRHVNTAVSTASCGFPWQGKHGPARDRLPNLADKRALTGVQTMVLCLSGHASHAFQFNPPLPGPGAGGQCSDPSLAPAGKRTAGRRALGRWQHGPPRGGCGARCIQQTRQAPPSRCGTQGCRAIACCCGGPCPPGIGCQPRSGALHGPVVQGRQGRGAAGRAAHPGALRVSAALRRWRASDRDLVRPPVQPLGPPAGLHGAGRCQGRGAEQPLPVADTRAFQHQPLRPFGVSYYVVALDPYYQWRWWPDPAPNPFRS